MLYKKNDPSPKPIKAVVVAAADNTSIEADVVAYHITATTRDVADGLLTHVANGKWSYAPTQAETNYDEFAIEFYHADAVGKGPIVHVFPTPNTIDEVLADLTVIKGGSFDDEIDNLHILGEDIRDISDAVVTGSGESLGEVPVVFTIQSGGNPVQNATVRITSDEAGLTVVKGPSLTDASGQVTFYLSAGSYYRYVEKTGFTFTNPQSFTVA